MRDHLANDDNTFSVSAVTSALTIQSQIPYRGRVLELMTQENASEGHCKHAHEN